MKPVGEPDAGNRHVRFDERGEETERCRMAQATAPLLDSTFSKELLDRFGGERATEADRKAEHLAGLTLRSVGHPESMKKC
jgi:hypothetical protein